jgi:hypothetical protein
MNKLIFKVITISLVAMTLLTSCNQKDTLQDFYVEHNDKPGYISTSIPKGIIGIDESKLSEEAARAYNSIDKVSLIAMPINEENMVEFQTETAKLDVIFKDDKYKLLMSHNNGGTNFKMMYDGTQDAIDEIIVYGKSEQMGFGVARVLGNDMNIGSIMKMMSEMDKQNINSSAIEGILKGAGMSLESYKVDSI